MSCEKLLFLLAIIVNYKIILIDGHIKLLIN